MSCPRCRHANPPQARFCGACGEALQADRSCPACGAPNAASNRFCYACGRALSTGVATARDPRAYTPRHLAEEILNRRSALEGEHKSVTVLFADVAGSMELAERVDAEEWHRILDRFFQILAREIHRFEGTINQYTGDGVMALFGAPIAHEDHAQRACRAALALRRELRRFGEELKRERNIRLETRIGLNSGEVVVGKIGDDLRMDYTAQGPMVGVAERMQKLADPGSVYLAEATAKRVAGYFELRDLGSFRVRGVQAPVRVYELEGEGPVRSRFELARRRGLSRFVGREDEMAVLERGLEQALAGRGRTIGIVAEAGTGKSRLVHELLERCRERGVRTSVALGLSHGREIPLLPLLPALREFYGIRPDDDDETARNKIAGRMLRLDPALAEDVPFMLDFLGFADPANPPPRMDPEAQRRRVTEVLRRQRLGRARAEPWVFVVEDLHWVDRATETVLREWTLGLEQTRTLQILTFRPSYRPDWVPAASYEQLPLPPLRADAAHVLLETLLGPQLARQEVGVRIRNAAGGNPFFLEEIVQALAESGALEGNPGDYRLAQPVETLPIPDSVQTLLAARIDRTSEGEKTVLQAASVVGRNFTPRLLQEILDLPASELEAALDSLAEAQFVHPESVHPELEYAFRHPLIQEVAYRSQLAEHRRRLHRTLGRALPSLYADRLDEKAALVAHHLEAADETLEAARWHRRAAGWVASRDPEAAARHLRRVLVLLERCGPEEERDRLLVEATSELLRASFRVGMPDDEARRLFERARKVASERGDGAALALLLGRYAFVRGWNGAIHEQLDLGFEAVRVAEATGDRDLSFALRSVVASAYFELGRSRDAVKWIDAALALGQGDLRLGEALLASNPTVVLLFHRALCRIYLGELDAAHADLDAAEELARMVGDVEGLGWIAGMRSMEAEFRGETAEALDHARKAAAYAERSGSPFSQILALRHLGQCLLAHREWNAAARAFEEALAMARARRVAMAHEPALLAGLALAHLGLGDVERARAAMEEALRVAGTRPDERSRIGVHLGAAWLELRAQGAGARARIETHLARAREGIERSEERAFEPLVWIVEARLSEFAGDREARRRSLEAARRAFEAMGARGHAARTRRDLETLARER